MSEHYMNMRDMSDEKIPIEAYRHGDYFVVIYEGYDWKVFFDMTLEDLAGEGGYNHEEMDAAREAAHYFISDLELNNHFYGEL